MSRTWSIISQGNSVALKFGKAGDFVLLAHIVMLRARNGVELSFGREGVGLAAGLFGGGCIGQLDVGRGEQLARSVKFW